MTAVELCDCCMTMLEPTDPGAELVVPGPVKGGRLCQHCGARCISDLLAMGTDPETGRAEG